MRAIGLHHVDLRVANYERSVGFYDNILKPLGFRKALLIVGSNPTCPSSPLELFLKNSIANPIHHFQINVSNIQRSAKFYHELLTRLGFVRVLNEKNIVEWSGDGTRIIVAQCAKRFAESGFHRKAVGLNHIALRASSRGEVDQLYQEYLLPNKVPILYGGAKEWPGYDPGYYAVYFEDPDRLKLEFVYVPGGA